MGYHLWQVAPQTCSTETCFFSPLLCLEDLRHPDGISLFGGEIWWVAAGGHRSQFLDGRCGLQPSKSMQNGNKPMRNISSIYYYILLYTYIYIYVAPHPEEKRVRNRNPWVVPSCCVAYTNVCLPVCVSFSQGLGVYVKDLTEEAPGLSRQGEEIRHDRRTLEPTVAIV